MKNEFEVEKNFNTVRRIQFVKKIILAIDKNFFLKIQFLISNIKRTLNPL